MTFFVSLEFTLMFPAQASVKFPEIMFHEINNSSSANAA